MKLNEMLADVFFDGEPVKTYIEPSRVPREGDEVFTADGARYRVDSVAWLWVPDHRSFGNLVQIHMTTLRKGR